MNTVLRRIEKRYWPDLTIVVETLRDEEGDLVRQVIAEQGSQRVVLVSRPVVDASLDVEDDDLAILDGTMHALLVPIRKEVTCA